MPCHADDGSLSARGMHASWGAEILYVALDDNGLARLPFRCVGGGKNAGVALLGPLEMRDNFDVVRLREHVECGE